MFVMNKKTIAFAVIVGVLSAGATYAKVGSMIRSAIGNSSGPLRVMSDALYPKMDLDNLIGESEIIVEGTVLKVLPSVKYNATGQKVVIGKKAVEEALAKGEKVHPIYVGEEAKEANEALMAKRNKGIKWQPGDDFSVAKDMNDAFELKKRLEESSIFIDNPKIVEIANLLKGSFKGSTITVREDGGPAAAMEATGSIGVTSELEGQTPMKADDKVILFLKKGILTDSRLPQPSYLIVGGPQGKYFIEGDKARREDGEDSRSVEDLISIIKSHQ